MSNPWRPELWTEVPGFEFSDIRAITTFGMNRISRSKATRTAGTSTEL